MVSVIWAQTSYLMAQSRVIESPDEQSCPSSLPPPTDYCQSPTDDLEDDNSLGVGGS